jgi:hypothetical protein
MLRPFSAKYMLSSAKYLFHRAWSPVVNVQAVTAISATQNAEPEMSFILASEMVAKH